MLHEDESPHDNPKDVAAGKVSGIRAWYLASRPKTLFAAVAPVVVGTALAIREHKFVIVSAFVALVCSVLIQIGTNFVNDLYDYLRGADGKDRLGPKRAVASGRISVRAMKLGIAVVLGSAFVLGMYLVLAAGPLVLMIGIFCIIAGVAYTAGPYPLAYHGLGDVFVFLFFGVVGTLGTYYVQAVDMNIVVFVSSLPVGALITNILVVNNYRDIEQDRKAGKFTLAVLMGRRFTEAQFVCLLVVSYLVPVSLFLAFGFDLWVLLPFLSLPVAAVTARQIKRSQGTELNKALETTSRLCIIFAILFGIGVIL